MPAAADLITEHTGESWLPVQQASQASPAKVRCSDRSSGLPRNGSCSPRLPGRHGVRLLARATPRRSSGWPTTGASWGRISEPVRVRLCASVPTQAAVIHWRDASELLSPLWGVSRLRLGHGLHRHPGQRVGFEPLRTRRNQSPVGTRAHARSYRRLAPLDLSRAFVVCGNGAAWQPQFR